MSGLRIPLTMPGYRISLGSKAILPRFPKRLDRSRNYATTSSPTSSPSSSSFSSSSADSSSSATSARSIRTRSVVAGTTILSVLVYTYYQSISPAHLDSPTPTSSSTSRSTTPPNRGKLIPDTNTDPANTQAAQDEIFQLQTNSFPTLEGNSGEGAREWISMEEVGKHSLSQDCWVVVAGKVYDVTEFHKDHPGGSKIIVQHAGQDVTSIYNPVHPPDALIKNLTASNFKGLVDPKEAKKSMEAYEAEQARIAAGRDALPPVETMLGLDEIQTAAESFLSPRVVDYYGAASLDGVSREANRSRFHQCRLVPRVMRNVLSVSPQTKIFGMDSPLPIYISPASNALLGHPEAELNLVRGAAHTGIVQGISAAASLSLPEILGEKAKLDEESGREMGMVYQVYVQAARGRTEEAVRTAVEGGCQALLLTVDSNVGDNRQTTEKIKGTQHSAAPGIKMEPFTDPPAYHDAKLNWDDLKWLKDISGNLPIYLKGVAHIDDVRMAKEYGLAGCILSNHGGRQLDQARTAFDSLRSIHAEDPQLLKDIEIYIDGGIRRGTDVLQALAFGARGVGLGRPFLWAQATYGEKGVIRAVRILESEIITAMRLLGVTSLDQVDGKSVECLQEIWK